MFVIDHDIQQLLCAMIKARFKRRSSAVPNSIDRIKFDFSEAAELPQDLTNR